MKNYTTDSPVYSSEIPIVEETDLVNAENNNAAAKQLLQNALVLHALIEALTQQLENNAHVAKDYTDGAYQQSTGYTDQKIADLINGAPTTLDTLGEIAKAMAENDDVVTALHEAMGTKANQKEVESWLGTKLDITGDSGSTTANYTSDDTETPSAWKNFARFTGIEKVKEFFAKVSTMASNLRWLYNQYNELNSKKESQLGILLTQASAPRNSCLRHGYMVYIELRMINMPASGMETIAIVPEGFRPPKMVHPIGYGVFNDETVPYMFSVDTNGDVKLEYGTGSTTAIAFSATYICGD